VYFDDIAAVFVKNTPENQHIIKKFRIDRNNIYIRKPDITVHKHDLPVPVFHTGNFYRAIGLYEFAETEYKKCIEQYPEYLEAHFALAEIYAEKMDWEKAEEEYMYALRIKPQFAEAHLGLADIYTQKGLLNEAIFSYKEALRIKPNLLAAHNNLGFVYIQLNRYPEAVSEFEAVLRIDPDNNMARELINLYKWNK
jgi:tetratricopeptide (TPR) repeat protein